MVLVAVFVVVFITENTDFINNNYKNSIIKTLEKNINALQYLYKQHEEIVIHPMHGLITQLKSKLKQK